MGLGNDERERLETVLVARQAIGELTWYAIPVPELFKRKKVGSRVVWFLRRVCEGLAGQARVGLEWRPTT
jgi:hypothetical protein